MEILSPKDLMERTIANLHFVESEVAAAIDANPAIGRTEPPYEVTQLVNSFLGALAHPWEALREQDVWDNAAVTWPAISETRKVSAKERVRMMRNAMAHGNIRFEGDPVEAVTLWNFDRNGICTWRGRLGVSDLGAYLEVFRSVAGRYTDWRQPQPPECV